MFVAESSHGGFIGSAGGVAMSYRCSRSGYKVEVDGVFLSKTRFVVHAALDYQAGLSEAERERLTPKAQMELLLAIYGESQRGRHRGARTVHVAVEGDRGLGGLYKVRTEGPPLASIS
jgi:hypothetical protein